MRRRTSAIRCSCVPGETPGINILRNVGLGYEPLGGGGREGYVRYEDVRVPADHMLGPRGGAFVVAQTRLGGGRIHHAMRTVGLVRRIFDMICERAVSRYTQGEMLANKQMVQEMIADSWMEIESFRLLTLQTAWKIDQYNDYKAVRADISAVKAMMQKVLHDVSARALQLHGSLGATHEMPFVEYLGVVRARPRRRPHRGAQGHAGAPAAEGRHKPHRTCSPPSTCCGCARPRRRRSPTGWRAFRAVSRSNARSRAGTVAGRHRAPCASDAIASIGRGVLGGCA